jgi:glycine/D-amino acid oxidase-like deaminating enzyme
MAQARILIVGGGIAGLSTAWWLARRGVRGVILVERESSLAQHSSRRSASILRTASADPVEGDLARRGAEFLRSPPRGFSDAPLLDPCGLVLASGAEGSEFASWERRALDAGDAEFVEPERSVDLVPHFRAEGRRLLSFPRDGRIDVEALLAGFERGAREGGVRFETGVGIRELLLEDRSVAGARLVDGREIRAERTVAAAGGWAGRLVAGTGSRVRLRPTRRHLLVTGADPRVDPRWPIVWDEAAAFYARPEAGGLLLCACDETDVDPDALAEDPRARDDILAKAARSLPEIFGDPARRPPTARFWSGIRTLSPDGQFVVGPDPDVEGLHWAAGLGGHGILGSAIVGELASASLVGDSDRLERKA